MLKFFMGKNTPERQQYIIRNLRFEHDIVAEEEDVDAEPIPKSSDDADASASQAA
jgi:topoisomerase-4 subunit B